MADIVLQNLCKSYGGQPVLQSFSARLPQGQATAIMGPSGSGKTTLVRLLAGLEVPDSGAVTGLEDVAISCVFQEDRLCPGLSAASNLALVLPRTRWGGVPAALAALGLAGEDLNKPSAELSGGQKRRVALARAMEAESGLVILDEAFKGLDEEARRLAYEYVRRRLAGRTLLVVTHDEAEAAALAAHRLHIPALRQADGYTTQAPLP